ECRQAQIRAPAQGCSVAQDDARPVRLGGQAQEGQLLSSPVLSAQRPARAAEGNLRRGRGDPDGDLSHVEGWHGAPRPLRQPLQPAPRTGKGQASRRSPHQARLPGPTPTTPRGYLVTQFLVSAAKQSRAAERSSDRDCFVTSLLAMTRKLCFPDA